MSTRLPPSDMIGRRFGRLTVMSEAEPFRTSKRRYYAYTCACDCGRTKVVRSAHLRGGLVLSCGCFMRQRIRETMITHGEYSRGPSSEFMSWIAMIQRCENQNAEKFPDYGGRGITVCERWRSSFHNFLSDMGKKPSRKYTLDRRDNDGNYEPSNCRWATPTQQAANRRQRTNARLIKWRGEVLSVTDWAKKLGYPYNALFHRLDSGWSIEKTLTTPVRRRR